MLLDGVLRIRFSDVGLPEGLVHISFGGRFALRLHLQIIEVLTGGFHRTPSCLSSFSHLFNLAPQTLLSSPTLL